MMQKLSLRHLSHNLAQAVIQHLSYSEFRVHFLWAGPSDDADVVNESEPEGVHPFLYEPIIASGSDEGGTSDLSEDISPRLLNLNVLIFK